jgi:hypothetical protein
MPEIITTIVLGISYFFAGGFGYLVRICHTNIEKEVIVIENKVNDFMEKEGIAKDVEKEFDTMIENMVGKIETVAGVDPNDIKFGSTSQSPPPL